VTGAGPEARRSVLLIRAVLAGAGALLVGACSSSPISNLTSQDDLGVAPSPRVAVGDNVPKGGGKYLVGAPYQVAGRTYTPHEVHRYSARGLASWYGDGFHGRRTANGEVFDMADLTAAHPTLPLPSYVRVTNLDNGRSMVVRVNDRGPFRSDRLIDVSAKVAALLDFKRKGTAAVRVDYVGPARMDGNDKRMLLASYRAPGKPIDDTLLAFAEPRAAPAPIVVASASRPGSPAVDFSIADDPPVVLTPANARARLKQVLPFGDGQTPILRASLTSSYAPDDVAAGPAQAAAARLVRPAVPKPARVIQLGVFSDPANAARIAGQFGRYGDVSVTVSGRLKVVRVSITDPAVSTESVVAAAGDAGLQGASLVAQ
jgi:rare lipoprotein A